MEPRILRIGPDRLDTLLALLLALIASVRMMRQMIALDTLADADPAVLVDMLAPIFSQLLGIEADPVSR